MELDSVLSVIVPIIVAAIFLSVFGIIGILMWNAIKNANNPHQLNTRSNHRQRRQHPSMQQHRHSSIDSGDIATGIGVATAMNAAHSWDSNQNSDWSNNSSASFDHSSWSNTDSGSSWSSGDSGGSWSSDSSSSSSDSSSGDSSGSW